MPYKSEKLRLSPAQDRRRKLTEAQKLAIQDWYATGMYSMQAIANHYGVSKKTVLLLVNPNSAEKAKQYGKEHWREHRQSNERRNAAARNTRHYKQQLYLEGRLADPPHPKDESKVQNHGVDKE